MQSNVTEDDTVLRQLMREATDYLENYCNRFILTQTVVVYLDADEIEDVIHLPCVPLVSVESIVTTDDDGDETTVTATEYQVRAGENPRVSLTQSGSWPTDVRDYDGMAITCSVGANGDVVPFTLFRPTNSTSTQLDDLTISGTFTGTVRTTLEIRIDTAATPDVWKFRKLTWNSNDVKTVSAWSSGVNISGVAQTVADGLSATWVATTGHTDESVWQVDLYEVIPRRIKMLLKALVMQFYMSKGRGVTETVSGQLIGMPNHLRHMLDSLRVTPWV
jgi:uncharacterized phiE125 gp8 family phage protein